MPEFDPFAKLSDFGRRLQLSLQGVADDKQAQPTGQLREMSGFGSNPGDARMFAYVPERTTRKPALVVALHGCTQSADSYARGSGWSSLADELGFVVLYPEQQRSNNPQGCFSWFVPGDTERDRGEVLSIRQMVDHAIREFGIDKSRVFVTGLSAGGAMASAMLATYPDVFEGGAIIAGLPYGCATTAEEAFAAMFGKRTSPQQELGDNVRSASQHLGPWPRISVWHGSSDPIVKPSNAEDIVRQWAEVHALPTVPTYEESVCGHSRRVWENAVGDTVIEAYTISGMVHGVPVATGSDGCGSTGPFFFDVGISSTRHIAKFWGLTEIGEKSRSPVRGAHREAPIDARRIIPAAVSNAGDYAAEATDPTLSLNDSGHRATARHPGAVIAAALRAAGLPIAKSGDQMSRPRHHIAPGPLITAALKAAGLLKS